MHSLHLMHHFLMGSMGSDLCSGGSGGLTQYREAFQVLYVVSFLGKLLVQRDVQGEHQRFHFVSDRTLQNTNTQNRTSTLFINRTVLVCFLSFDPLMTAPRVPECTNMMMTEHKCD